MIPGKYWKVTKVHGLWLVAIALLASSEHVAVAEQPKLPGIWQGKLKAGVQELRIVFHIEESKDGAFKCKMDSPDQGAMGIPFLDVSYKDGELKLGSKQLRAEFVGKFDTARKAFVGDWKQVGLSFPLTLSKRDKAPVVNRPQEPKKPYPYLEEEVTFENKKAGVKLSGTLTLPKMGGPFPAAILISGSGPQDRNEALMGHKPFLVLADHLTRGGIAVLRYDDRGFGKSTGDHIAATSEDFADDAEAALRFLQAHKSINSEKIGFVGHSEGGLIAPMIAIRNSDVAFIVLLAGPGLPGDQILYLQTAAMLRLQGANEPTIALQRKVQEQMFEIVRTEKDKAVRDKKLLKILQDAEAQAEESGGNEEQDSSVFLQAQVNRIQTPWFQFFLGYDPRPALQKVRCPVLAIIGEKDFQVPPKENIEAIRAALEAGGNTDATVKELPRLNHLFQNCETGALGEYSRIEETMAPAAMKLVADWILARS